MHTFMTESDGQFLADLPVSVDATLDFGFFARDRIRHAAAPFIWDGQFQATAPGTIEITSKLKFDNDGPFRILEKPAAAQKTVRYRSWDASEVFLVWGIDGWFPVSPSIRPSGTRIRLNRMYTPMAHYGEIFEMRVNVPSGSKLDCGFLITRAKGISDLTRPIWDGSCQEGSEQNVIDVKAEAALTPEYSAFLPTARECVLAGIAVLPVWLLFFCSFQAAVKWRPSL
jgi:hypothetical protein